MKLSQKRNWSHRTGKGEINRSMKISLVQEKFAFDSKRRKKEGKQELQELESGRGSLEHVIRSPSC